MTWPLYSQRIMSGLDDAEKRKISFPHRERNPESLEVQLVYMYLC
jgi:hypothetical protein